MLNIEYRLVFLVYSGMEVNMKKFIKDFFLNKIVLVTLLLLFSLVVYFFNSDFNLVFLLWLIQSAIIIFFKYRSSNSIISKTKLDKVFIYVIRLLFLFIETLCCFQFFVIFFVISYKLFYKNFELILGLSFVLFLISMIVLGYLYEKFQISKRFDETLSQFVFNESISGILFFLFLPFVKYNTVSDSTLFLIEYKRNF